MWARPLTRRCALTEIALGQLVAVKVPELSSARQIRLVYRRGGELSHAAGAFLEIVRSVPAARRPAAGDAASA